MKRKARCRSRRYYSCSKSVTNKLKFCLFVSTTIVCNLLLSLCKEYERSIRKLETLVEKEKAGKHAAKSEEAVALGLLTTTQEQLQAAERQVCNRVRIRVRA
jgi:hypothetical protein